MNPVKRNYTMADADLIQTSDTVMFVGARDQSDLAVKGVTPMYLLEMKAKRDAFSNYSTDEELMGDLKLATLNMNDMRRLTIEKIIEVVSIAKIEYGEDHPNYIKYGVGAISRDNNNTVCRKGFRVLRVATSQLTLLADLGMNKALLDELADRVTALDDRVDDQIEAKILRNIAMQERTNLGNALYAMDVNVTSKGKAFYQFTDEAKYNDYLLYNNGTTPAQGQTIASIIPPGEGVSHLMAEVQPTTTIIITNDGITNLNFFFADEPTDETGTPQITFLAGGQSTYQASALGYDEATLCTLLNVFNTGMVQGSYRVHWE